MPGCRRNIVSPSVLVGEAGTGGHVATCHASVQPYHPAAQRQPHGDGRGEQRVTHAHRCLLPVTIAFFPSLSLLSLPSTSLSPFPFPLLCEGVARVAGRAERGPHHASHLFQKEGSRSPDPYDVNGDYSYCETSHEIFLPHARRMEPLLTGSILSTSPLPRPFPPAIRRLPPVHSLLGGFIDHRWGNSLSALKLKAQGSRL